MMLLWATAGVPLGIYNIVEGFSIALRIQPQILTLLSLITWAQCYHYSKVGKHLCSWLNALSYHFTYSRTVGKGLAGPQMYCSCYTYRGRNGCRAGFTDRGLADR